MTHWIRAGCVTLLALGLTLAVPNVTGGQVKTNVPDVVPGARPIPVERIRIHGAALEGNLEGNLADRDVIVLLPPSYARDRSRRFPVVYALHGYSIGAEQWSQEIHVPQTIEGAFAKGAKEMIVVLPDSKTVHSPCCLSPRGAGPANPATDEALAAVRTPADSQKLPFGVRAQLASAAAWSPNPKNPPLYLDLPIGPDRDAVLAKWAANAPLAFVDQYIANLRRYRAIAIDVGDKDNLRIDAGKLHDALDKYGVPNSFEIYPGTHTSDVAVRFQEHVLPFFSRTLSFEQAKR